MSTSPSSLRQGARAGASDSVAVIAGGGLLPYHVMQSLEAQGRTVFVVAIRGEACPEVLDRSDAELGWGEIGRLFKFLVRNDCQEVILIGSISRRPDFTSIVGDLGTLKRLPKIMKAMLGGDDSLLTKVIGLFEVEGFAVIGIKDAAPELLAGTGALGNISPSEADLTDMALAVEATRRLGDLDIGQAAVAVGGRVVAVEGAEGTDAMLQRCADLRANGRIKSRGRLGVLAKTVKPNQDLRVDLPTIGPRTVELVASAGLSGIGVEAGGALIADRETTLAAADAAGIFIYGIDSGSKARDV